MRDRRMKMAYTSPTARCSIPLVMLAALGSAAICGCGSGGQTSTPAPDGPTGMPDEPQVIDPWHHHPGAGEVIEPGPLIATSPAAGAFTLAEARAVPPLVVSAGDFPGVVRVVGDLRDDIARTTHVTPQIVD